MEPNSIIGDGSIMSQTLYRKMENVKGFGFVAKCNCGHTHRFKGNEINLEKSQNITAIFKNIYKCPKCGTYYDGITDDPKTRESNRKQYKLVIYALLLFGLMFVGYKLFSPTPSYTNINNATNQQLQNFFNWDHKQQQEKYDNQPAFNNNK